MQGIKFYFTDDNSIGLFDDAVDDIYHSTKGAFTEAVEKFILPSGVIGAVKHKAAVNVLDICYGIGYNSKALLTALYAQDTSINIDALEYNENLFILSAFLKDKHTPKKIQKYLVNKIFELYKTQNEKVEKLLLDNDILPYLSQDNIHYWRFLLRRDSILPSRYANNSFLHNIYYHYNSFRYLLTQKDPEWHKNSITPYLADARKTIKTLSKKYDVIFLDAFTPAKQPTLWTFHFFEQIKRLMDENSVLVTYSNSASIRGALISNGFFLGRTVDKNAKRIGTVASLNQNKIITPLTNFELGLIETTAGIFYEDKNLNNSEKEIKLEREYKVKGSARQTSSSYIKKYRKSNEL